MNKRRTTKHVRKSIYEPIMTVAYGLNMNLDLCIFKNMGSEFNSKVKNKMILKKFTCINMFQLQTHQK